MIQQVRERYNLDCTSDSTRRRDTLMYIWVPTMIQQGEGVRYSLVDSSSNLSSNYDSTRRRKGSI